MLQTVKESAVMDKAWDRLSEEQRQGKFKIGSFHVEAKPEYTEEYKKLIASFNKGEE